MAAKKPTKKLQSASKPKVIEQKKQSSSWLNFFNFGESYSSLLLGIVVVIITTILLIFLVKDRNSVTQDSQKGVTSTKTQQDDKLAQQNITPTEIVTTVPTNSVPTVIPTRAVTARPTKVIPTATQTPVKPTSKPVVTPVMQNKGIRIHTIVKGETLWSIAEKYFKSGYNWVDIAQANKLTNPGVITTGMKLTIPSVAPKTVTVAAPVTEQTAFGPKITTSTYTVRKGDHLWGIAVRSYGDGYKWVEIARVNNIKTPSVIQPGLILKLPRTSITNK